MAEKRRAEIAAEREAAVQMGNFGLPVDDGGAAAADTLAGQADEEASERADERGEEGGDVRAPAPASGGESTGWHTRDDGTRVRRLKVNGEIRELTEAEYDRAVGKELAGDHKLELANRMQQQLYEREQRLARRESMLRQPPPDPGADADLAKALDEYHQAVYEGDADAARERLMRVMQAGRGSSTPNLDALADEAADLAAERMTARTRQQSMKDGWAQFQEKFSDIASNPARLAYADVHLKEVRANHPDWEPAKQILEAGKRTAEELGLGQPAGRDQVSGGTGRDERMERKRNLKPLPKPGGASSARQERPRIDMSPAAKIARLRAGRAIAS